MLCTLTDGRYVALLARAYKRYGMLRPTKRATFQSRIESQPIPALDALFEQVLALEQVDDLLPLANEHLAD